MGIVRGREGGGTAQAMTGKENALEIMSHRLQLVPLEGMRGQERQTGRVQQETIAA